MMLIELSTWKFKAFNKTEKTLRKQTLIWSLRAEIALLTLIEKISVLEEINSPYSLELNQHLEELKTRIHNS